MDQIVRTYENTYPLTMSQANIWALEQSLSGTPMNNICATLGIEGHLDFALLQRCLNELLASDPTLRTRIVLVDGEPRQYQEDFFETVFPFFDFTLTNEEGFSQWEAAITRDTMPLIQSPLYYFALFKLDEKRGGVLLKTHHLISDGWSQVLMGNRVSQAYLARISSPDTRPVAVEGAPSYFLHLQNEQKYLSSPAYQRDETFWRETLAGELEPAALKDCVSASKSPIGRRKTYRLGELLNHRIFAFCQENRVAPFSVFYMALAIYLNRTRGANRFSIGVPIFNRTNHKEKCSTGMFVSTLPFISEIDENWNLQQFNHHLFEQWFNLLRHQRFPYARICDLAKEQHPQLDKLFHIVLSYQNSKMAANTNTSLAFSGSWHYSGYQAEDLIIHLSHMEDEHRYSVSYDYLTQLFSEQEIDALHRYLVNILQEALAYPERPIWQLAVVGDEEKEDVLFRFNDTVTPRFFKNTFQPLEDVYRQHGQRVALIQNDRRLTYHALEEQGNFFAAKLLDFFPDEKIVVAILLPKNFSLFAAMVGVLQSGNAWVFLSPDLPPGRVEEILEDSGASVLITNHKLREQYAALQIVTIFEEDRHLVATPAIRAASPDDLAYLVYTSGSTGRPKGVEIEGRNLLNFSAAMAKLYGQGAVLSLCNTGFDAFILESIVSLFNGRTIVLPSDQEQMQPAQLAQLILRYRVGFLALTPSRLQAYLQDPTFLAALSKLEAIVCGGEAFPPDLLQTLLSETQARIYNQYGPSETTVGVTMKELNHSFSLTIGKPMENCRVYILDAHQQPLPIGAIGELYIGGLSVGRGYHNNPFATQELFLPSPFEPGERLYRTGDLGCWTVDGELVLAGRKDGQVKLRGLRIELQEISSRLSLHPDVQEAVARLFERNGKPCICAYYTASRDIPQEDLLVFLATYLPTYMIPAKIERVDVIPLTANGKVDKNRLPYPTLDTRVIAAKTPTEERILQIYQEVLENPSLHANSDYFLEGGDSLLALALLTRLEQAFGRTLRLADLYACRTPLKLARLLGQNEQGTSESTSAFSKAPLQDRYPLSSTQQSLFVQAQLDPTGLAYHMPGAFRLPKDVSLPRLEHALQQLIAQEPLLRASFTLEGNGAYLRVQPQRAFSLERLEAADFTQACSQFLQPFSLGEPPLLHAALWQEDKDRSVLFLDMPHIIGDGISTPLILSRLDALYQGKTPSAPYDYLDYTCWQLANDRAQSSTTRYWQGALRGLGEPLRLPTDEVRPQRFDYRGSKHTHGLSAEDSQAIEDYCFKRGITPYMFFVGAFGVLLGEIGGSQDFLLGTPTSGRTREEFWQIIGPFVNTLPLRVAPNRNLSIWEYLEAVKEQVVGLLDHPDISLEELISLTGVSRSLDKNPLYSVLFSLRPIQAEDFCLNGQSLSYLPIETGTAKLDLNLEVAKEDGAYHCYFEYASSLFLPETVAFWGRCYATIIDSILADDSVQLKDMSVLSLEDKQTLIDVPNHTFTPYLNLSIDVQADHQALLHPQEAAVVFHSEITTYAQIKEYSDRLAGLLQELGVRRGDNVAFCLQRGPAPLVAMLAILKTGAAYVPLIPTLPAERLTYMLKNAQVKLVLVEEATASQLPEDLPCPLTYMDYSHAPYTPVPGRSGDDVMHILYTSGSTGQPKGVMLLHRSLSNLLPCISDMTKDISGRFLCIANPIFDTYITETLFQLALGRTLVMADEEEMMLPWKMAELIRTQDVTMIQFTPSRLQMCLNNPDFFQAVKKIGFMMVCGEVFHPLLLARLQEAGPGKIVTLYGPTEVTVYMTAADLTFGHHVTIGSPFQNCRVYALDENRRPVLPTAEGELYIAGECLSAGYIGQPQLTQAAYLEDPFFPGSLMYKTGDIARLRLDGSYDFVGRRDNQVKLNGQRIELDEITGQMLRYPGVREAVTVVTKTDAAMTLRGFVVEGDKGAIDVAHLKSHLRTKLPSYMVPSTLVALPQMPRTPSGKTDILALSQKPISYWQAFNGIGEVDPAVSCTPACEQRDNPSIAQKDEAAVPQLPCGVIEPPSTSCETQRQDPDLLDPPHYKEQPGDLASSREIHLEEGDASIAFAKAQRQPTPNHPDFPKEDRSDASKIPSREVSKFKQEKEALQNQDAFASHTADSSCTAFSLYPESQPEGQPPSTLGTTLLSADGSLPVMPKASDGHNHPSAVPPTHTAIEPSLVNEDQQSDAYFDVVGPSNPIPATHASSSMQQATKTAQQEPNSFSLSIAASAHADKYALLLPLWKQALAREDVKPHLSFFDQGGTSLAALGLLGQYYNAGWTMTLSEFYSHPTLSEQAVFLQNSDAQPFAPSEGTPFHAIESTKAATSSPSQGSQGKEAASPSHFNSFKPSTIVQDQAALSTLLLTGATGFLGAHLVYALAETGQYRILSMVRGREERLWHTLQYYFGSTWVEQNRDRILPIQGDILLPDFGLQDIPPLDFLLHAAADVRHFSSDDTPLRTNLLGTQHAIGLARKTGATLLHISTISVSGEYLSDFPQKSAVFTELDGDIGQNWQDNIYVKGKFLAEQQVRQAMQEGLAAKIFRVGRLTGRSTDGMFQQNPDSNTFYILVRSLMLLDYYPRSLKDTAIEMTPVDSCAQAILTLLPVSNQQVFHVYNPHTISLRALAHTLNRSIQEAEDDEFSSHLRSLSSKGVALSTLLDLWNRFGKQPLRVTPSALRTVQELKARHFCWEKPDVAVTLRDFLH